MAEEKSRIGVFNDQSLQRAVQQGHVILTSKSSQTTIQPSSLDLRLGSRAWRLRASFLPGKSQKVQECLTDDMVLHEIDLRQGAVLERGCVYLVELQEQLNLPSDITAHANPKSSTGRIDVFTRLVTDRAAAFEKVAAGYRGPLYVEIAPRTFSIKVRQGSSLNQLRLRRGGGFLSDQDLASLHKRVCLAGEGATIADGLTLTVNIAAKAGETIGYRARRHAGLIDVDQVGVLALADYWEPVQVLKGRRIILDPGEFYILASREWLRIPPDMAAEMVAIDPLLGEFRVHYAGFFDPGFGWGRSGEGAGSRAVLEVRGHEAPFVLEDGQPVARLAYEPLIAAPHKLYGVDLASNYQGQGLKLSKHFKSEAYSVEES
ncbi:MAG: 2'-deoxycytidine 5'-triphosphate deaminase [bacterium]